MFSERWKTSRMLSTISGRSIRTGLCCVKKQFGLGLGSSNSLAGLAYGEQPMPLRQADYRGNPPRLPRRLHKLGQFTDSRPRGKPRNRTGRAPWLVGGLCDRRPPCGQWLSWHRAENALFRALSARTPSFAEGAAQAAVSNTSHSLAYLPLLIWRPPRIVPWRCSPTVRWCASLTPGRLFRSRGDRQLHPPGEFANSCNREANRGIGLSSTEAR